MGNSSQHHNQLHPQPNNPCLYLYYGACTIMFHSLSLLHPRPPGCLAAFDAIDCKFLLKSYSLLSLGIAFPLCHLLPFHTAPWTRTPVSSFHPHPRHTVHPSLLPSVPCPLHLGVSSTPALSFLPCEGHRCLPGHLLETISSA